MLREDTVICVNLAAKDREQAARICSKFWGSKCSVYVSMHKELEGDGVGMHLQFRPRDGEQVEGVALHLNEDGIFLESVSIEDNTQEDKNEEEVKP